jgi:hypothetical protein
MHYGKPTEATWSHLSPSLANLAKTGIGQLTALVKTRLRRMQYRPGVPAAAACCYRSWEHAGPET